MQRRSFLQYAQAGCALAAAGSTVASLTGCTLAPDADHTQSDTPRFDANQVRPARVAWVLSSGGPRGFVHVGVLKALEELQLQPDLIVGGSVGALVGALYACGIRAGALERMAMDLSIADMGRLAISGSERFAGTPIADFVNRALKHAPIEKLPMRFAAAVMERNSRDVLLFNAGDCGLAVQASCAIEGTFTPVRIRGMQYVDADLAVPLPVRMARALGATKVLAVDASAHEDKAPAGSEAFRPGDLRKRQLTEPDARNADLTLHPELSYYVSVSQAFRERCIRIGYEDTMRQAVRLVTLHAHQ